MVAPVWRYGMSAAEDRVFTVVGDTALVVEGTPMMAWRVDEHRRDDRSLGRAVTSRKSDPTWSTARCRCRTGVCGG